MRTSTRWRRSISGRTSIRTASPARCASSSRSHPTKSTPSGSDVDLLVFAALPLPDVQAGDDLAALIANAIDRSGRAIEAGDVVVVAQKIVSKAEGGIVPLAGVTPSGMAEQWAREWGKDPRVVEVVLQQSRRIVRMDRGVLIAETH